MPNAPKIRVTVEFTPEDHERLKVFCFNRKPRISMQSLIRELVLRHVSDAAKRRPK